MKPRRPFLVLFGLSLVLLVPSNHAETRKRGQKIKLKNGGNDIAKKFSISRPSIDGGAVEETGKTRMLAPGFYSQECNAHKKCEDGKYCHMFLCVHCLKENVACTQNGQCCKGQCVYGRCKKEGASGKPGTFCDRHEDCTDPAGTCCVREPAINPHISICKPPLKKNMVCGPINFFRTVYVGAEVQTACGPCEKTLICKQVGIFGVHEICVDPKEDK